MQEFFSITLNFQGLRRKTAEKRDDDASMRRVDIKMESDDMVTSLSVDSFFDCHLQTSFPKKLGLRLHSIKISPFKTNNIFWQNEKT